MTRGKIIPLLAAVLGLGLACTAFAGEAAKDATVPAPAPAAEKAEPSPAPAAPEAKPAQPEPPKSNVVYVVPIKDFIGPGLAYFVKRSVQQAKDAGAGLIVFEINTPGGSVATMLEICKHIDSARPIPTVAFISGQAASAGSLISIACDRIYMAAHGTIGSAQIITEGGTGGKPQALGEKYVSYMRATFRAWAEKKGHNPDIAAAMADRDIELTQVLIDGKEQILTGDEFNIAKRKAEKEAKDFEVERLIIAKGKLLNLSAQEALGLGFIEGIASSTEEVIAACGVRNPQVTKTQPDWTESYVRWVSHPAVSGLLMMVGLLGVWMELKSPGFGLPGVVGIACFAIMFLSRFMLGHADAIELLVFLLGFVLLAVEIFVIPGFGIVGVAGIGCIFIGLLFSMQDFTIPTKPWDVEIMWENVLTIMVSMAAFMVVAACLLRFLPNMPILNRLIRHEVELATAGYVSSRPEEKDFVGKTGVAQSDLRPAGRAEVEGQILDVMTEGDYIDAGQRIEVVKAEGNRLLVRGT